MTLRGHRLLSGLLVLLSLAYPFAVYYGLQTIQPRWLGLMLLTLLVLRYGLMGLRFVMNMAWVEWLGVMLLASLATAISLSNRAELLLYYPIAVSSIMLMLFARTLWAPPSMIERFARLREPALPPAAVHYTRQVTKVWCGFFLLNALVALATTLHSRQAWLVYNGLVSYALMGVLFLGEMLVRKRVKAGAAA
ncbi:hypothetical protein [Leeia sp.]|uniref:COG4648 family protein n=1 Tax=Leeia sp. TaxID=2884678 RepID=UPI0035AE0C85